MADGDIRKIYFEQCKARYVPLGFRRSRQTYARIVNDVLQTFTFKRYSSGCDCTVEFGVLPLCEVLEYPDRGLYNLCNFEVPTYYADWNYDRHSEASMNACVQYICSYIDRHLLLLFTEADCCAKALPALIALDRHFHNVRQVSLQQRGIEDLAGDWRELSMQSTQKFFMALKCGKYDYAKEIAQVLIPNVRPEYQKKYRFLVDRLDAGDTVCVENTLYENEQETLRNLAKYRLKPIKNLEETT